MSTFDEEGLLQMMGTLIKRMQHIETHFHEIEKRMFAIDGMVDLITVMDEAAKTIYYAKKQREEHNEWRDGHES